MKLQKLSEQYIKKITSSLKVKVDVFIDGNNLYVNLDEDLDQILEIFIYA